MKFFYCKKCDHEHEAHDLAIQAFCVACGSEMEDQSRQDDGVSDSNPPA